MKKRYTFLFFLFLLLQTTLSEEDNNSVIKDFVISSAFCDFRNDHFHTGVDIVIKDKNKEIRSLSDGELIFYNINRRGGIKYGNGNFVVIEDFENGLRYNYSHIKDDSVNCHDTGYYYKGQIIGLEGSTGYSTGEHLHLEVEDLKNERLINPLKIIKIKDDISPRILDVYFITEDNKKISLVKEYNVKIKRGGDLYISCYDKISGSNFNTIPYRILLYVDGKEVSNLSFEFLDKCENYFALAGNRKLNDVYSSGEGFNYHIINYKSLPGIVGFKIVVEDFSGNRTVFSKPLRILMPD